MSSMQLQVAVERLIADKGYHYEIALKWFKKSADVVDGGDDYDLDYFVYYPKFNDGFTVNFPNNVMYIDYMFNDTDDRGIDIDITKEMVDDVLKKFEKKFLADPEHFEWKLKVFYYYNGGCAGICEVE